MNFEFLVLSFELFLVDFANPSRGMGTENSKLKTQNSGLAS